MTVIVSLTSMASRLVIARYTISSLFEQTWPADRVILNISHEAYLLDEGVNELPFFIDELREKGLEINWVENMGSYRKLLPILSIVNDNDIVVTCDDDVIYGPDWLKALLTCSEKYPDSIICGRARQPVSNFFRMTQSYVNWAFVKPGTLGSNLVPIGISGIVYKKNLLDLEFVTDRSFLEYSPRQDDLWFKIASARKKVNVMVAEDADDQVFPISTKSQLSSTNAFAKYKTDWASIFSSLFERIMMRFKAYLGFEVCENDRVWSILKLKFK